MTLIRRSQKLLEDTIACRNDEVAAVIGEIREEQYAPQFYNNEQALRAVIKYAYVAATDRYIKIEEMPSVVELEWNKTAGGAISQIKKKKYTATLKPFAGKILLVGISYNEKTGEHACCIERG